MDLHELSKVAREILLEAATPPKKPATPATPAKPASAATPVKPAAPAKPGQPGDKKSAYQFASEEEVPASYTWIQVDPAKIGTTGTEDTAKKVKGAGINVGYAKSQFGRVAIATNTARQAIGAALEKLGYDPEESSSVAGGREDNGLPTDQEKAAKPGVETGAPVNQGLAARQNLNKIGVTSPTSDPAQAGVADPQKGGFIEVPGKPAPQQMEYDGGSKDPNEFEFEVNSPEAINALHKAGIHVKAYGGSPGGANQFLRVDAADKEKVQAWMTSHGFDETEVQQYSSAHDSKAAAGGAGGQDELMQSVKDLTQMVKDMQDALDPEMRSNHFDKNTEIFDEKDTAAVDSLNEPKGWADGMDADQKSERSAEIENRLTEIQEEMSEAEDEGDEDRMTELDNEASELEEELAALQDEEEQDAAEQDEIDQGITPSAEETDAESDDGYNEFGALATGDESTKLALDNAFGDEDEIADFLSDISDELNRKDKDTSPGYDLSKASGLNSYIRDSGYDLDTQSRKDLAKSLSKVITAKNKAKSPAAKSTEPQKPADLPEKPKSKRLEKLEAQLNNATNRADQDEMDRIEREIEDEEKKGSSDAPKGRKEKKKAHREKIRSSIDQLMSSEKEPQAKTAAKIWKKMAAELSRHSDDPEAVAQAETAGELAKLYDKYVHLDKTAMFPWKELPKVREKIAPLLAKMKPKSEATKNESRRIRESVEENYSDVRTWETAARKAGYVVKVSGGSFRTLDQIWVARKGSEEVGRFSQEDGSGWLKPLSLTSESAEANKIRTKIKQLYKELNQAEKSGDFDVVEQYADEIDRLNSKLEKMGEKVVESNDWGTGDYILIGEAWQGDWGSSDWSAAIRMFIQDLPKEPTAIDFMNTAESIASFYDGAFEPDRLIFMALQRNQIPGLYRGEAKEALDMM